MEITEIKDYLSQIVPFDSLSPETLSRAAKGIRISYFSSASGHVEIDYDNPQLYIVRTGAFEVRDKQGELLDRLGEGDFFGFPSLLTGENVNNKVTILEDGLVYLIDLELFKQLRNDSREFDRFFNRAHAKRMKRFEQQVGSSAPINITIESLLTEGVVSLSPDDKIVDAAQLMSEQRISSLIILEHGQLAGIVTDRDLRSRVLAVGLDGQTLIRDVMTENPSSIDCKGLLFEASMMMSTHNIHHLPVLRDNEVVGMLTTTDIVRSQNNQPIFLIGEINRQQTLEGLVSLSKRFPALLQSLIASDARAEEIGRILTLLSDSLTRQLLKLGEEQFGTPPFPYSWIVFGSQGRMDQTAGSDQDNAMILSQTPTPEQDAYFKLLSEFVCHGLDACGYIYCPGEIMAQTDKWRVDLKTWQGYFKKWVDTPSPEALLNTSIFFDMRLLSGSEELFELLQTFVLKKTRGNQIFIASMAGVALSSRPPLGFFGKFVLDRDGEENKALDLKHRGVALINDIARVYALAEGISEVNTQARLDKLLGKAILSEKDVKNLKDALEFIGHMRLKNQGKQAARGKKPSNYLKPGDISRLLRHQLKDAFEAVHSAQNGLQLKFTRGLF
ncbi:cyclic nucleotide-binding protein [Alteromonadales bacterium alter-6D02]|nr:cyclic nucleotide-binding protein [Alteromonadales bacterium alter-6D02]